MSGERELMERKHIFVINHDPMFLELMRELLQMERYNVTTTNFVPTTFRQIVGARPDLIIVDIMVRDQASWLLLEQLRRDTATHQIPVIIVSTDPQLIRQAQQEVDRYGGDRFLVKPLDVERLLVTIRDLTGQEQMTPC
jgi:DNA-binding response OmpR family regulator